jgi:hypothetical protein
MRRDKDRSGKWLLGKHGGSVVRLAGITGFTSWRHLTSEVVAPRRLLDGLIELRFPNEPTPTLVLVEIESYADSDADRQVLDDLLLVAVERGAVPEVVSLVLKPKGNVRVTGTDERFSRSRRVRFNATWPVVQLWELDADGCSPTRTWGWCRGCRSPAARSRRTNWSPGAWSGSRRCRTRPRGPGCWPSPRSSPGSPSPV